MIEERRRILDMLAQGKISVSDAERLLRALGGDPARSGAEASASSRTGSSAPPKHLHIHIRHHSAWAPAWQGRWWARQQAFAGAWTGGKRAATCPGADAQTGKDVDVRIPLSLLRSGMKLAAFLPGRTADLLASHLKERGIDVDLSRLDPSTLEQLLKDMGEITVDLDGGRGQVRITCE